MILANADPTAFESALTSIGSIVTQAIGIVTENPVLMIIFCAGLLGIGFKIVKQSKRAVK